MTHFTQQIFLFIHFIHTTGHGHVVIYYLRPLKERHTLEWYYYYFFRAIFSNILEPI